MTDFDGDFASAAQWAEHYRSLGWSIVPALQPGEGNGNQWKRPAVAWKAYQRGVPAATWSEWFGPTGRFLTRQNIGLLTGESVFVLDLDLYKTPSAAQWWAGVLAVNNSSMEIETASQRTGGGGRQLFFRAPPGWTPPTNKTPLGIDIRGVGGFAMLPPSRHESGENYRWEDGLEPGDVGVVEAPIWLCVAIDQLILTFGSAAPAPPGATLTASPSLSVSAFGSLQDGREAFAARHCWGWVVNLYREAPIKLIGVPLEAEIASAFAAYVAKVTSRLADTSIAKEDLLEREGRGLSFYREKFVHAMDAWDTKVREHASIAPPERKPAPETRAAPRPKVDPETGEVLSEVSGAGADTGALLNNVVDFTPYVWRDAASIPQRQFLYGRHYIRQFVSTDISPGGVGKSSLAIVDSIAMVAGKDLVGHQPRGRLRVAYWNGEDPLEELQRRVQAVAQYYNLEPSDLDGLFVDTGRRLPIVLVQEDRSGIHVAQPVVDALIDTILRNRIDVVIIDPFVSSHRVTENDNNAIERVVKQWAQIADVTNCSINLIHHSRKTNGAEVTVEDGRGAVALLAAARSARSLNQMSEAEAAKAGIERRRSYFRVDDGKSNLTPPMDNAQWYRLASATLKNGPLGIDGDDVGVVTSWTMPDPMATMTVDQLYAVQTAVAAGRWRESSQAQDWVGRAVARVLGLDVDLPADKARIKTFLKTWIRSGALVVVQDRDEHHRQRAYVIVGNLANEAP